MNLLLDLRALMLVTHPDLGALYGSGSMERQMRYGRGHFRDHSTDCRSLLVVETAHVWSAWQQ